MRRTIISVMAAGAAIVALAAASAAKTTKHCKAKHEQPGCVLNANAAAYRSPGGFSVAAVTEPPRRGGNSLSFLVPVSTGECLAGRFIVGKSTVKAGKQLNFNLPLIGGSFAGSIKVDAKQGTLTLRTHLDAIAPSPSGMGGRHACTTSKTFPLKRSG